MGVIGASAREVAALIPPGIRVVTNQEYEQGMGSSLRAGLDALSGADRLDEESVDAALVMLVDLPGVGPDVIARIIAGAGPPDVARSALLRAGYAGAPGHPVLLGRAHWGGVRAQARFDLFKFRGVDRGARDYLSSRPVDQVECGDIGSGIDVDRPDQLGRAGLG